MIAHDIIIRPIITEKSMMGIAEKKYTNAVEEAFKVKVAKVNTVSVRGKLKRQGRTQGYTKSWKKAVVTLTEDSKSIEFFEGMM